MSELINIWKIFVREWKRLLSDQNLRLVVFLAPLFYSSIYGSIYYFKTEYKVPIAVRDLDNTAYSRWLIREVGAHQSIEITDVALDEADMEDKLSSGEIHAVMVIPNGFERQILYGEKATVKAVLSSGRLLVLSDVGTGISQAASTFGVRVAASAQNKKGIPTIENPNWAQPLRSEFRYFFNPYLTYGDMILPAIMLIVLAQLAFIGASGSSAKENSAQTWGELFSFGASGVSIAVAKLFAFLAIFTIFGVLMKLILFTFFDIRFVANEAEFLLVVMAGVVACSAMGLFFGTFFRHRITAFATIGFTSYPFFLSSGYAWPNHQLPGYIQAISSFFPTTPFMQSLYSMTQLGNGIEAVVPQLWLFLGQTVLYVALYCIRMYFIRKRQSVAVSPAV